MRALSLGLRVWVLIATSLVFYGDWEPRPVPLLAGSIGVNWLFARAAHRYGPRLLVPASVALNLLVLGIFKYLDFFATTLSALAGAEPTRFNVILPLGISFFTFQQISYLVDLRRGRAPQYAFAEHAL